MSGALALGAGLAARRVETLRAGPSPAAFISGGLLTRGGRLEAAPPRDEVRFLLAPERAEPALAPPAG